MIPVRKLLYLFTGILAAAYSLTYLFSHSWEIGDDAARLMGTARNILEGELTFNGRPATKFPPFVPALLAGLYGLYDEFAAVSLLQISSASMAIVFSTILTLRVVGSQAALIQLFLLSLSPFFISTVSGPLNTDVVYLALSSLILLLACSTQIGIGSLFGLLVLAVTSPLTRTVGVSIPLSLFFTGLWQLSGDRRAEGMKLAGSGVVGLVATVLWLVWSKLNRVEQSSDEYFDSYFVQFWLRESNRPDAGYATVAEIILRFFDQAVTQLAALSGLFLRDLWISPLWFHPLIVIPGIFLGAGALALINSRYRILSVYFFLYCCLICLWPFKESFRFVFPIFPLSMIMIVKGYFYLKHRLELQSLKPVAAVFGVGGLLSHLFELSRGVQSLLSVVFWFVFFLILTTGSLPRLSIRAPVFIGSAVLIVVGLLSSLSLLQTRRETDLILVRHAPVYLASRWIKENTSRDEPVILQEDSIAHFFSERPTLRWPVTDNQSLTIEKAARHKVKYLIATDDKPYPYFVPTEGQRLETLQRQFGDKLKPVFHGTGFQVFQFVGL